MFERGLDRLRCNFVEHNAEDILPGDDGLALGYFLRGLLWLLLALFLLGVSVRLFALFFLFRGEFEFWPAQHFGQVSADRLAFAVGVACQVDSFRSGGGFLPSS